MGLHQVLLFYFGPIFLLMILAEYYTGRKRGLSLYSKGQSTASILIIVGQQLFSLLSLGILAAAALAIAWENRLFELPTSSWWYVPLLFLAHEFFYYWFHRFSHSIRWFWATHSVHHSAEELNVLASYRLGWTGWLSNGRLMFLPMVWFGFHPAAVGLAFALNLMYQSWLHTALIGKLGPLEGIFNTPSAHRVHHARNADYLDRNLGGVLVIFDRMFGTYQEERDAVPCEYGLTTPSHSLNPVRIALHDWINLFKSLKSNPVRHWPGFLFGPPGWAPDGKGRTSADIRASFRASLEDGQSWHPHDAAAARVETARG